MVAGDTDPNGPFRFVLALAVASGHAGGFFDADIYPKMTVATPFRFFT
jgi:hypothetical protein